MMTNADIKELLGKITQGNWRIAERDRFNHHAYTIRGDGEHEINTCICKTAHWLDSDSFEESEANAEFIAKTPQIINDLLSQVEKDQRVIERLTETLKNIRSDKLNASFMNMYIDEALKVVE